MKLEALAVKAAKNGHFQVAATARAAMQGDDLDQHINVVGSIHDAGLLKNVAAPYVTVWRTPDPTRWAARCIERLLASDTDYWALAALLGMTVTDVKPGLTALNRLSVRNGETIRFPNTCIALFTPDPAQELITRVLELGADQKTGELVDVSRTRAVHFEAHRIKDGTITGSGYGTYFMRATLPHGVFRGPSVDFTIDEAWTAPKKNVWSR